MSGPVTEPAIDLLYQAALLLGQHAKAGALQEEQTIAELMAETAEVSVSEIPSMLVEAFTQVTGQRLRGRKAARDPVLAYWLIDIDRIRFAEVFARSTSPDDDIRQVLAAKSFVAYLLDTGTSSQFVSLLRASVRDDFAGAVEASYGRSLESLEEQWYNGAALEQVDKPTLWGVIKRTASYWRPHRKIAVVLLLMLGVQQAFTTAYAMGMKTIIDNVLAGTNDPHLLVIIGGLFAAFVASAIASLYGEKLTAKISVRIINGLRQRMFEHLLRLASDFYGRTNTGNILARFSGDLETLKKSLTKRVVTTLLALVGLLINLPMLFVLEWRLALLVCLALPLMIWAVTLLAPSAADAGYALQTAEADMVNSVQESVRAHAIVRSFHLQGRVAESYEQELEALAQRSARADFLASLVGVVPSLGVLLIQLGVTALGAWMAFEGDISAGTLVAFITLLAAVSKDAHSLSKKALPAFIKATSGVRRVEELLGELPIVTETEKPTELSRLSSEIQFRDVSFSYTGEAANLRAVNLTIPAKSYAAFVGPSGSGKSTVLSLVARFYDPVIGAVCFDDTDIRMASLASLRRQLGIVFQDSFLFNTSIRENIRLAKHDASDAEVEEAAKAAAIYDVIMTLPKGLDTMVGEAGGRLSGGQRQRIAIARAMLHDPAVLLLDEATSALDPGTEAEINETIRELARGRTVISVTHRLAAITCVERIFVMKDGCLAESGTHQELLDIPQGVYAELWAKQTGFSVTDDGQHAQIEAERLQHIDLFRDVQDRELLESIAKRFHSEQFEQGQDIIKAGHTVDRFYVLVRGQVEIVRHSYVRKEQRLAVLEDGDAFGILPLVLDEASRTTVRASSDCLCLTLSRDEFLSLVNESPEVAAAAAAVQKQRYLESLFGKRAKGARPAANQSVAELVALMHPEN